METDYQLTEPVFETYGKLEDFIMVSLGNDRVQIRRVIKSSTSVQEDI